MKKILKTLIIFLIIVAIICIVIIIKDTVKLENRTEKWWNNSKNVNDPVLLEGMKAIGFEEGKEEAIILTEEQINQGKWYDYVLGENSTEKGGTSKWANAMTKDGSMWVWIPRYAYKIEWDGNEKAGKIDIVFLKGNTNYNKEGVDVTTLGYKIHPAFVNGENTGYQNGEWDAEIPGIWVSKFEAGYAGQKNTSSENISIIETSLHYLRDLKNVQGDIKKDITNITYPVFIGKTFSYNQLEIGEMYDLSRALTQEGNPYGFDNTVDSHMMKNSEWGAVAYLAHSGYGRNGTKISINNLDASKVVSTAGTVTGYTGVSINESKYTLDELNTQLADSYNNSHAWYTKEGKLGSSTGNLYGIYDMNGGASEYTAGYIEKINEITANLYAKSMMENKSSTKYYTVYKASENGVLNENYKINKDIFGDAIFETSKNGTGYKSWFGETSIYIKEDAGFFLRSGAYNRVKYSGIFDFTNHSGHASEYYGFRCILISK